MKLSQIRWRLVVGVAFLVATLVSFFINSAIDHGEPLKLQLFFVGLAFWAIAALAVGPEFFRRKKEVDAKCLHQKAA